MPAPLFLLQEINLTLRVTPLLSGAERAVAARSDLPGRAQRLRKIHLTAALPPGWSSRTPGIASSSRVPQSAICRKNRICPGSVTTRINFV